MYTENRKKWIQSLRDQGQNPYPHKFERTIRLDEFHNVYTARNIEDNKFFDDEVVAVTGRIISIRGAGNKLLFIDITGDEAKVQVMATANNYQGEFA